MNKPKYQDSIHNRVDNLFTDYAEFVSWSRAVRARLRKIDKSLVASMKRAFGRQYQTWIGGSENRRFHIWRHGGLWVLCHEHAGLSFEVSPDADLEMARVWLDDFAAKLFAAASHFKGDLRVTKSARGWDLR